MRTRGVVGVALLATVLVSGACSKSSSTSTDDPTSPTSARGYTPAWTDGPCATAVPDGLKVTCGTLTVPENRSKPAGRQVKLAVVRLHSLSARPEADPIVYLHGGPGSGTLRNGLSRWTRSRWLERRDIIVLDQRGVGRSEPSLECPERERAFMKALAMPNDFKGQLAMFDTATRQCYDRLSGEGIDLGRYNTTNNAADIADLRTALGIAKWNLYGVSYGTRLALVVMRNHPQGVRSVILDSVYPPSTASARSNVDSGTRAFDALANGCATDPKCHAKYPDLKGDVERLAAELDTHPFAMDYTDPTTGVSETLHLDGNDAVGGLFNALYDTDLIPQLPSAIHDMANGGRGLIPLIAQEAIPFVNDMTEGAFLSTECADNGARVRRSDVDALRSDPGRASLPLLASWNLVCRDWPVTTEPKSFGDVVHSSIPTLVISGEYDPITPPSDSKAVANALSDAEFISVPHGGHGPGPDTPCTQGIMDKWFDELNRVDTSCAAAIVPSPFS
ncbi:MAG: alpha/beta hydrolase [Microthrixaceae bacterium]